MHGSLLNRVKLVHPIFWIVLAFLTSGFFAATVRVALADHYHCDGLCHGFVHGDSLTDGSFFTRTREGTAPRSCQIDTVNNPSGYATEHIGDYISVCQIWSHEIWQSPTD